MFFLNKKKTGACVQIDLYKIKKMFLNKGKMIIYLEHDGKKE